jgi:hypothetical protein
MARQIFIIDKHWATLLEYVLWQMLFPLITIFIIDFMIVNHFKDITLRPLTLATAMYLARISSGTRNNITRILCIIGSITSASAYGFSYASVEVTGDISWIKAFSIGTIIIIFLFHGIERYNRHVAQKEEL